MNRPLLHREVDTPERTVWKHVIKYHHAALDWFHLQPSVALIRACGSWSAASTGEVGFSTFGNRAQIPVDAAAMCEL